MKVTPPQRGSLVVQMVKHLLAMQETWVGSLGQEDPLEKKNGNPLQYPYLVNPMDRGVWQATVHGFAKESEMTERLNNCDLQEEILA